MRAAVGAVMFLAMATTTFSGEEFVFPVGTIAVDNLWEDGWPFDLSPEALVDLRSRGVEVVSLSGIYELAHDGHQGRIVFDWVMEDVDTLAKKLARADSFGLLAWAGIRTFDDALRRWGHDPVRDSLSPYFRWDFANRYSAIAFRDSLDLWVSWVVDSLRSRLADDDTRSLYRYFFWDEPFTKHVAYAQDTIYKREYDDYWLNIWEYDDTTGLNTDSLSVGTLLKQKIEEKDTLQSVWFNLAGDRFAQGKNAARGLCSLKVDAVPNPFQQLSFDAFPFWYGTAVGDTHNLRKYWTSVIDTIVKQTKSFDPLEPPPVYVTQLQSWGSCNVDTFHCLRITIPEEVKELANLAVLHETKGIMHFVLQSFTQRGDCFGNLLDHDQVPFDAPYEEYVYARKHDHFSEPDCTSSNI
jgi:hypothetical protein